MKELKMSKKTTEEILKGLEICGNSEIGCTECPYYEESECGNNLKKDAFSVIKGKTENCQDEDKLDGIKETTEIRANEDAEKRFTADFDLDDMNQKCREWQRTLAKLGKEQMDKNHIATMAVTANVDALKGNDTTKAFIGGVSVSFKGTAHQRTEILYQLIRTCYNLLKDEGTERTANAIMDQVFEQIKSGKDHFDFDPDEVMKHSFMELMDRLRGIAKLDDDDEDTSD